MMTETATEAWAVVEIYVAIARMCMGPDLKA
jgi:hypothetical protein